jgi:mannose-6-phosphate isomerase-like protein (cupin superfamily)
VTHHGGVPEPILLETDVTEGPDGVVRSMTSDDLHTNVVTLGPGGAIGTHRNDSVDVVVVVLAGELHVDVDHRSLTVGTGNAVLIPKGTERTVRSGVDGARYLTVHQRRGPLTIGPKPPR